MSLGKSVPYQRQERESEKMERNGMSKEIKEVEVIITVTEEQYAEACIFGFLTDIGSGADVLGEMARHFLDGNLVRDFIRMGRMVANEE